MTLQEFTGDLEVEFQIVLASMAGVPSSWVKVTSVSEGLSAGASTQRRRLSVSLGRRRLGPCHA